MDIHSTESDWGHIPFDVLDRILSLLTFNKPWRLVASIFHLVNRHWRDAIRRHFTLLNPRENRPFQFFRDVQSFSHFPNLQGTVLRDCKFQAAVEWVMQRVARELPVRPEAINQSVPEMLSNLNKLHCLKIERPDSLEPFLAYFCDACPVDCLHLKQACLRQELLQKMKAMTLKKIKFRAMDVGPGVDFLDFMKAMDQLESVELSFVDTMWLGSVSIFAQFPRLKYLRIYPNNFDFNDFSALSTLQELQTLILDGRVNGDRLDLSELSSVTHLSINCPAMPLWIPNMEGVKSLALRTSDNFKNLERQWALMSVAPRLTALQLIAENAKSFFIRRAIATAVDLESIKVTGHTLTSACLQNLQKLKEVAEHPAKNGNASSLVSVLSMPDQLPELTSLSLTVEPYMARIFDFLEEPNRMKNQLTKLVARNMSNEAVTCIVHHLHRLKDLRLPNGDFWQMPFESVKSNELSDLKNLCLSKSQKTHYYKRIGLREMLSFCFVTRLDHLAFKERDGVSFDWKAVQSFNGRYPHVVIDENMDWEPEKF